MRELVSVKAERIPIGIVGAGRTRDGLGPFLATFFEEEGFRVAAVSGRSLDRATVNAETLGPKLGHEVTAFASPAALCAAHVAALVIASPVQFHLEALQAATYLGMTKEQADEYEKRAGRISELCKLLGRFKAVEGPE